MHLERKVLQYWPGTTKVGCKDLTDDLDLHHIVGIEFLIVDRGDTITFRAEITADGLKVETIGRYQQLAVKQLTANSIMIYAE